MIQFRYFRHSRLVTRNFTRKLNASKLPLVDTHNQHLQSSHVHPRESRVLHRKMYDVLETSIHPYRANVEVELVLGYFGVAR
jgi:hypothetical protein